MELVFSIHRYKFEYDRNLNKEEKQKKNRNSILIKFVYLLTSSHLISQTHMLTKVGCKRRGNGGNVNIMIVVSQIIYINSQILSSTAIVYHK